MKLLKIRNQFINIDLLESVMIEGDMLTLTIAGEKHIFAGQEAVILQQWFNRYAFDLMEHQEISMNRLGKEEPALEALHSQVKALGLFRKPFVLK